MTIETPPACLPCFSSSADTKRTWPTTVWKRWKRHLVKPVDEAALDKLLDDFGARKQEVGSVPALQHTSG